MLAQALRFRIGKDGHYYASLSSSSGEFYIAPEVLSILGLIVNNNNVFSCEQITQKLKKHYADILKNIPTDKECQAIVTDLTAAGLLIPSEDKVEKYLQGDGFGDPWIQWAMLADKPRCNAYFSAIKEKVTAQSVVLDIGAGTGFLSAAALQCGAKQVTAIEETKTANVIEPLLKKLNLLAPASKKFLLHNKNSFDVSIPKDINLIVSELFGNDPFSEGVLSTLRDIGTRLPHKKVTFIPKQLTVYFEFINLFQHPALHRIEALKNSVLDPAPRERLLRRDDNFDRGNDNFEDKFRHAAREIMNFNDLSFPLSLQKKDFERISRSIEIKTLALDPPLQQRPFSGTTSLVVSKESANAIALFWFRIQLTEHITLSSHPMEKDSAMHWSPMAIPLKNGVRIGEKFEIKFCLNEQENGMNFFIKSTKD